MDWISNSMVGPPFLSRPSQSSLATFLCNNSNHDPISGLETSQVMISPIIIREGNNCKEDEFGCQEKKRKLSTEQVESLERSFQEEIKLEPDRKMKLARELGLEPRQVAVWFQNRRARWRAKKLEHLYELLKQEFELVTKEKLKLQQEVLRLKSMLEEQGSKNKQISTCHTEASCEETVESTNEGIQSSSSKTLEGMWSSFKQQQENQFLLNFDDYNPISPSYWAPNYP